MKDTPPKTMVSHEPGFESHIAYLDMLGRRMHDREPPGQNIRQLEAALHREW
jgi:hypothetical protein